MKNVLFSQAQYLRKREFTILTQLVEENGKKHVTKEAIYEEGVDHIKSIHENYLLLKKSKNNFKLPKTELVNQHIVTEYIEGTNLASEIESLLIEGELDEANSKVSEFINYLNKIPTKKANPYESEDFTQLFDPSKKHDTGKAVECWYPGFHDINFDNFIKKGNDYYFIDFEWCFDFPLPKNFLMLRAIFFLSLKLNRIIKSMTSKDFQCISFYTDLWTPVKWLNLIEHDRDKLQQMLDYEYNLFSKKIKHYDPLGEVQANYEKTIFSEPEASNRNIFDLRQQIQKLSEISEKLNQELENERTVRIQKEDELNRQNMQIDKLSEENQRYQTRSFQFLRKLESTRLAQIKPLRIFVRKTISLFTRIRNLFR